MGIKLKLYDWLGKQLETTDIATISQKLLDQVAFERLAIHIGVSYIANTISKCEFRVYENGKEVNDSELYYKLNVSPNKNQNSSQFMNQFIETYFYNGEALIVPRPDGLYCASSFDVDDTNPLKEYEYFNITFNGTQMKNKQKSSKVIHIKLDNRNVKNLIDGLYSQYNEIIATALNSYKRTNGAKYKIKLDQYRAGDANFQEAWNEVIQKQLKAFIENNNAVYPETNEQVLEKFNEGNPTNTGDIIAMRKEVFEVVAQALKIPLSMMYGNITNMNEIVKVYLSFCIDPLADMIGEELTRKCFTYDEWRNGYRIKLDTSSINHIDVLEVADKLDKAISCGALNIDEIRRRIDYDPLNTEFSNQHFITRNYAAIEEYLNNDIVKGGE